MNMENITNIGEMIQQEGMVSEQETMPLPHLLLQPPAWTQPGQLQTGSIQADSPQTYFHLQQILANVLGFSPADLASNRSGHLSAQQYQRLRWEFSRNARLFAIISATRHAAQCRATIVIIIAIISITVKAPSTIPAPHP
jgi:hypothetical protein